ncbi:KEOPS complex subunit Cgi121 [Thermococcus waiotapuensis]|uniref:KEOPS complex subunit Cgi121 n=1 Tax=Thermococcus waiotapuensis TaxID=90909 RepID=A0AAE4NUF0_9EURY|nr:KEOPS complex subunit Cgi121 [Thermococcus waiotapuensis]MDV3103309.1 KEOPS complex subunit Cgi121 [Thermococcus waiotapuensis]
MEEVVPGIVVTAVYVDEVEKLIPHLGSEIQAVSGPCFEAVAHSAILAKRSFERGTNRAKTPGGELLIRLAGSPQIKEAIKKVGLTKGVNYLVFFGSKGELKEILEKLGLKEAPMQNCDPERAKKYFEISALVEAL